MNIEELNKKIETLLDMELLKNVLDNISENFKDTVNNFNDEQKRRLVDIVVDKVLVSEDYEENMVVDVIYRFNVDSEDNDDGSVKPKDSLNKQKNANNDVSSFGYGTTNNFNIRLHIKYLKNIQLRNLKELLKLIKQQ